MLINSGTFGILAAMRRASALILQGKARSDDVDKLGADFMAAPPEHLACAFPDNTVAGQEQHEFIGSIEPVEEEPRAALGHVDDEAVARWNSNTELDLSQTVEAAAWRPASLLTPSARALVDGSKFWPPQHLSVNYIAEQRLCAA